MKVLIVGSGGREYSLGKKVYNSPLVDKIYFARGNGGTLKYGENLDIGEMEVEKLVDFARENNIDLTIVGPENPLELGIVDAFEKERLKIFGVTKANARFESSKKFTKEFLMKYKIPTAAYRDFDNEKDALAYLENVKYPIVIKADGLAAGKGVYIVEDFQEASIAIGDVFDKDKLASDKVVIEEYLLGKEVSSICLVSNNRIIPFPYVRDFKKIGEKDTGENTGGVGAVCPVVDLTDREISEMETIHKQIEEALNKGGYNYTGVLFIGFMLTGDQTYVLEFNVRFGDPETELLMEKLQSDLVVHIIDVLNGTIDNKDLIFDDKFYLGVVGVSKGYPRAYKTGFEISGIENENLNIVHNASKYRGGKYYTNGGRVLMSIGEGNSIEEARDQAYEIIKEVSFKNMYYRKDIK